MHNQNVSLNHRRTTFDFRFAVNSAEAYIDTSIEETNFESRHHCGHIVLCQNTACVDKLQSEVSRNWRMGIIVYYTQSAGHTRFVKVLDARTFSYLFHVSQATRQRRDSKSLKSALLT